MRHYIRLIVQYLLVCDDWIQCTFMTYGNETHNKYEIILPIYYITSNFIFIEYAGQSRRETVHLISFNFFQIVNYSKYSIQSYLRTFPTLVIYDCVICNCSIFQVIENRAQ